MAIKIITDSSADLPQATVEKYGITVIPFHVHFGNEEYLDGVDLSKEEFYSKLATSKFSPKTSQITEFQFDEIFRNTDPRNEYIVITISSKMSYTYTAACSARDKLGHKNIYVFDSNTVTMELGAIVTETAKEIARGSDIKTVLAKVEWLKSHSRLIAVVDTLKYLKRGGRLSATAAVIATLLHIKPVISIEGGLVVSKFKPSGLKKAYSILVAEINKRHNDYPVYFAHAAAEENLSEFIKNYGGEMGAVPNEEQFLSIGSTVGTHTGPNCLGAAFFVEE